MSQTKAQLISDLVQALNFTGTASAPANGVFLSATNTLQLSTASTPRLTINSDGHVDVVGNLDVGAGIDVTGAITSTGNYTITNNNPTILLFDSNANSDFAIDVNDGEFAIRDHTNALSKRLSIASDGTVDVLGNLDVGAGIDVTGNITATGTASTGQLTVKGTQEPQIIVQDSDTSHTGNDAENGISFRDGAGTQQSMIGHNNSGDKDFYLDTAGADHRINFRVGGTTTQLEVESNAVNAHKNLNCLSGLDVSGANLTVDGQIVSTGSILRDDGTNARITITSNSATNARILATTTGFAAYTNLEIRSSTVAFKNAGNTQTVTLNANGLLLVGKTSPTAEGHGVEIRKEQIIIGKTASGTVNGIFFAHGTGANAYVGGLNYSDSATSLATSSDERLKKNIEDADDASPKIDAIKVRKFDWKKTGEHQEYGFVAQELEPVFAHAVHTGQDDFKTKTVDYASLVPMLVKEIQSLRSRVATLEAA